MKGRSGVVVAAALVALTVMLSAASAASVSVAALQPSMPSMQSAENSAPAMNPPPNAGPNTPVSESSVPIESAESSANVPPMGMSSEGSESGSMSAVSSSLQSESASEASSEDTAHRIDATPTTEAGNVDESGAPGPAGSSSAGPDPTVSAPRVSGSSSGIRIGGTRIGDLSPTARKFVDHVNPDCASKVVCDDSSSESAEESIPTYEEDADDPIMQSLQNKLRNVHKQMGADKKWIQSVTTIIATYKMKIRAVQEGLRKQALNARHIKELIRNQHQVLARKRLEEKLESVNAAIAKMDAASSDASTKSAALESVRSSLQASIQAIEYEVNKLKARV